MDDLEQWWESTDPESWGRDYYEGLTPRDVVAEMQALDHLRALLVVVRDYVDVNVGGNGFEEQLDQLIASVDEQLAAADKRLAYVGARDARERVRGGRVTLFRNENEEAGGHPKSLPRLGCYRRSVAPRWIEVGS